VISSFLVEYGAFGLIETILGESNQGCQDLDAILVRTFIHTVPVIA